MQEAVQGPAKRQKVDECCRAAMRARAAMRKLIQKHGLPAVESAMMFERQRKWRQQAQRIEELKARLEDSNSGSGDSNSGSEEEEEEEEDEQEEEKAGAVSGLRRGWLGGRAGGRVG